IPQSFVLSCWTRFRWRTQMDEQRKYAILFAATILAARKLNEIGVRPCPARECAIADAVENAKRRREQERSEVAEEMVVRNKVFQSVGCAVAHPLHILDTIPKHLFLVPPMSPSTTGRLFRGFEVLC